MTDLPAGPRQAARRRAAAPAAHRGAAPRDRRRDDPQDAVAPARRHARRERADALPGPARQPRADHRLRLEPGRLRHGLPVLRHRPGRPDPQPVHRRDRRPGARGRGTRRARGELPGGPGRLSNVVFMGMGEPLANYARVLAALHRLIDPAPAGLGLSPRSITVSTVGLVPAIDKLADEDLDVTLAVSLHAPDDELRDTLVPVNTRWKVAEVLAAADALRRPHRPPLLDRVRDDPRRQRPAVARRPARRAAVRPPARRPASAGHVNLIPLNPTPGSAWDASPKPVEREFVRRLRGARRGGDGARHPRARDRRRLRPARRLG